MVLGKVIVISIINVLETYVAGFRIAHGTTMHGGESMVQHWMTAVSNRNLVS